MADQDDRIEAHVAGATVRHESPFSELETPSSDQANDWAYMEKWVVPFYEWGRADPVAEYVPELRKCWDEIDANVVLRLLSEKNWRPRRVAARFAAIKMMREQVDPVGRLLLRSDLCCVGDAYCEALAVLNTPASTQYLARYLDYYLDQPHLWFDQVAAMGALAYLDRVNGTTEAQGLLPKWLRFLDHRLSWNATELMDLNVQADRVRVAVEALKSVAKQMP